MKLPSLASMISFAAHKRFSKPSEFGFQRFGYSQFGDEFIGIAFQPFGTLIFGDVHFGEYLQLSGIYQSRMCKEGKSTIRMKYYLPYDPHDPIVDSNRAKFRNAVNSGKALTLAEQICYNQIAKLKHITGQNLFIREYMSSH